MEINMKQMIYKERYEDEFADEILDQGTYDGYDYIICSLGHSFPVAYVRIPEDNVLYKNNDQDSINEYLECFDEGELPCNGGITFADEYPYCLYNFDGRLKDTTDLKSGWYIGWDYAHSTDFYPLSGENGKKWTVEEVLEEVYNVIKILRASRETKGE